MASIPTTRDQPKALVVATHQSIPFECYSQWFPGATVSDWAEVKKVRGKAAEYLEPIVEWAEGKPYGSRLLDKEARQLLGLETKQYHNRIGRNASFETKLKTFDIVRIKGGWQLTKTPLASEEELEVEHEMAA